MKTVVAIGGNALITPGGSGDINDQFAHSRKIARPLADLVQAGCQLTITHGNGPQVGNIMRRVEIALTKVYPIDLGLAVADTQAGMGYMISQTLRNELRRRGIDRACSTIITTVLVDIADPAFANPTKPIGAFLTKEQADHHRAADGWKIIEDSGRGWRRIVPSPRPLEIVEMPVIRRLVDAGELLVAGGGGGIPVILSECGEYHGIEAVIDKDLTSAMIAAEIRADVLVLVTGVESVFINYNKPTQQPLRRVRLAELDQHIADNQFPPGSMLPKVQAARQFLTARNNPDSRAIITDIDHLPAALEGRTGTTITL